jgi:hypothetical protein
VSMRFKLREENLFGRRGSPIFLVCYGLLTIIPLILKLSMFHKSFTLKVKCKYL